MKRFLILFIALVGFLDVVAQKVIKVQKVTDHSTHIIGDKFEGVIFSKDYPIRESKGYKGFTPSPNEIAAVEKLLLPSVISNTEAYPNDSYLNKNINAIKNNLSSYFRQYFGYITPNNEKVIFVNCLFKSIIIQFDKENKKGKFPDWQTEFIKVQDGGANFWRIQINLNSHVQFDFNVNPGED